MALAFGQDAAQDGDTGAEDLEQLQAVLAQYRGGNCQIGGQYHGAGTRGTLSFGAEWNVRPTPALIEALESLLGRGRIAVLYSPPPTNAGIGAERGTVPLS